MRKSRHYQNIDELIQGIKLILSEDRCSLSDEEKVHLNDVIIHLENSKKTGDKKPIDWSTVIKGFELLFKVFTNIDDISGLF
jgi:hypothetical protein